VRRTHIAQDRTEGVARARRNRVRKLVATIVALTIAFTGAIFTGSAALAVPSGGLTISTSSPATQPIGSTFSYEVSWSCLGLGVDVCASPRLEIPISLDSPPGAIEDMETWGIAVQLPSGSAAAFSCSTAYGSTQVLVTCVSSQTVSAGVTENILVTVHPNHAEGDGAGFVFGPAVLSSSSFAAPVASNSLPRASVTVADLAAPVKRFVGVSQVSPGVGRFVYEVQPSIRGVWDSAANAWSDCAPQAWNNNSTDTAVAGTISIVDTLPTMPGLVFVAATGGGVHDALAGTVTWTSCGPANRPPFYVTVDMPSASSAGDPAYDATIVNELDVTFTDTAGTLHQLHQEAEHDNVVTARLDPIAEKCGRGRVNPEPGYVPPAGVCNGWFATTFDFGGQMAGHTYNMSVDRLQPGDDVTITDWMPCATSPTANGYASEAGCAQPVETIYGIGLSYTPGGAIGIRSIELFYDDGTSDTFSPANPLASLNPLPTPSGGRSYVGFSVLMNQPTVNGRVNVVVDTRLTSYADRAMWLENTVSSTVENSGQGFFSAVEGTGIGVVRASIAQATTVALPALVGGQHIVTANFLTSGLDPATGLPIYTIVLPEGYGVDPGRLSNPAYTFVRDLNAGGSTNHIGDYDVEIVPENPSTGRPVLVRLTPRPGTLAVPSTPDDFFHWIGVSIPIVPTWGSFYGLIQAASYSSIGGLPLPTHCLESPATYGAFANDPRDLDGDGLTSSDAGCYRTTSSNYAVPNSAAASSVRKHVRDIASSTWLGIGDVASTPSGAAEYLIHWENAGQPPLSDIVLYDILPFVGDTGTTSTNTGPRGSAFSPVFTGLTSAVPAGASIQFSASANPCRPEVYPGQVACDNDWTSDPAVLGGNSEVKALRIVLAGTWASGTSVNVRFGMSIPAGTDSGRVAWNTVAQRASSGGLPLAPAETGGVGITMPAEVLVSKTSAQSGAPVGVGDVVEYEITAVNQLASAANGVTVSDSLAAVLQYATYNDDAEAFLSTDDSVPLGSVSYAPGARTLTWTGSLQPGEAVTIRFTVTTTARTPGTLGGVGVSNAVTGAIGEIPTNCQTGLEPGCSVAVAVIAPAVSIAKSAPGAVEGSSLIERTTLTWDYVVTNTGNEPLEDLAVVDDQGVVVDCGGVTTLAVGASVTCTGTGSIGDHVVDPTVYRNVATVTGEGALSGDPAEAEDDWSVRVLPYVPWISVIKSGAVASSGAPIAEGSSIRGMTMVTWSYLVTNVGNEPVEALEVVDDRLAPNMVSCPVAVLAVGASTTCTATGSIGNALSYTNLATATATGSESGDGATGIDDWSVLVDPLVPLVSIDKFASGVSEFPAQIMPGTSVTWTYRVTNTGPEALTGVVVTDSRGVAVTCPATVLGIGDSMDCTGTGSVGTASPYTNVGIVSGVGAVSGGAATANDPWSVGIIPPVAVLEIDKYATDAVEGGIVPAETVVHWEYEVTNTGTETVVGLSVVDDRIANVVCPVNVLAPGASTVCTASGSVGLGPSYTNVATARGVGQLSALPTSDQDTWTIEVDPYDVGVTIDKRSTNAVEGGVVAGDTVVHWEYVVTNAGEEQVVALSVVDDRGVVVSCPLTVLDPGASMVCTGSGSVGGSAGTYTNVGTVTGTTVLTATPVTDDDEWSVEVHVPLIPSLTIVKGSTNAVEGDVVPVQFVVAWNYAVTNTGEEPLVDLLVVDDRGVAVTCPVTTLAIGETVVCTGSGSVGIASGYRNVATATATGGSSGDPAEDDDDWSVGLGMPEPAVRIIKDAVGIGAGAAVEAGRDVTWEYTVTNTGGEPLVDLDVVDSRGVTVTCPALVLAVGATVVCEGTGPIGSGPSYSNVGTALAAGIWSGVDVDDDDEWSAAVMAPLTVTQLAYTGEDGSRTTRGALLIACWLVTVGGAVAVLRIHLRRR